MESTARLVLFAAPDGKVPAELAVRTTTLFPDLSTAVPTTTSSNLSPFMSATCSAVGPFRPPTVAPGEKLPVPSPLKKSTAPDAATARLTLPPAGSTAIACGLVTPPWIGCTVTASAHIPRLKASLLLSSTMTLLAASSASARSGPGRC